MLEDSKSDKSDFAGLVSVQGRRRAIILVASGIDTFSKINYGDARKIAQNAGIPIYIIGTAELFYKSMRRTLPATDSIGGMPGRMTFLQATEHVGEHLPRRPAALITRLHLPASCLMF